MKKVFLYLFAISFTMTNCGGEDELIADGYRAGNTNANNASTNKNYGRLEFPKLKDGTTNRVIIHYTSDGQLNYAIEWDDAKKAQRWTCYRLDAKSTLAVGTRKGWWGDNDPFQEDMEIPTQYRTTLADYKRSGYQRGHICPSNDRLYSKEANEQTFYLSNIQPQLEKFNNGVWLRAENVISNSLDQNSFRDTLYIVKGGTIDKGNYTSASTGILVPKYFFMAIMRVYKGQYNAIGLWFEHKNNTDTQLASYAVSIDELEEKTGIDFFCNLPDEREKVIEAQKIPTLWKFN